MPSPDVPLRGSCMCGTVRFQVTAPFTTAGYCHCTRCRRRSGAMWSLNGTVGADAFELLDGSDAVETWQPPDGLSKSFCRRCGGHVFSGDPAGGGIGRRAPRGDRGRPRHPSPLAPVGRVRARVGADPRRRAAPLRAPARARRLTARGACADRSSPPGGHPPTRAREPHIRSPAVTAPSGGSPSPRFIEALLRVSDAALATLSLDELLATLLERIAEVLRTDTAAVLLLDEAAGELVARAAKGIEEEVEQGVRIPLGKGFAGRIAAERRAVTIDDVDHADILNPILREKGIRSLLGVPLIVEGEVLGALHVGTLTPRKFTDDDRELLQLAADRAALAIAHGPASRPSASAGGGACRAGQAVALQRVSRRGAGLPAAGRAAEELLERITDHPGHGHGGVPAARRGGGRCWWRGPRRGSRRRSSRASGSRSGAGSRAGSRRSVARSTIEDVDHADILNPILREKGIRSLLGRAAAGRGTRDRRAARRHAHAAHVHR